MDCTAVELACRCLECEQVGPLRSFSFKSSLSFSKQQSGEQDTYVRRNRNLPHVTSTSKRGILQDRILPAVVFLLSLQVCSSLSLGMVFRNSNLTVSRMIVGFISDMDA